MKKKNFLLISESERNSILGMHKSRILKENDKDWSEEGEEMDTESDFSKMEVKDKSKDATENLSDKEQDMLRDFIETKGMDSLQDMIKDSLKDTGINESDMDDEDEDEDEMSESEYKIRSIIDKIVTYATAGAAIGMLPAAMFISGGVALGLGIGALAGTTLKDIAWFKSGGKYSDHHYDKSDKSRKDWHS